VLDETVAWFKFDVLEFEDGKDRVADPNEASVTKSWFALGRRAVPKSTAVPEGEVLVSVIDTFPPATGNIDKNPVLFLVGSPFTVAISMEESALKNTCETVFRGPDGGVVWFMAKGRRVVSRGVRPVEDMERQAMPATAPELATQAWLRVLEMVRLVGNSPRVEAGWPIMVSFVGSVEEIWNMEMVFEPGFTAIRVLPEILMEP
jgi:hypothetical protein